MRWISDSADDSSTGIPPAVRGASHWPRRLLQSLVLILLALPTLLISAPEKHLTVYSTVANYSLTIVQRQNRDYVGLFELLDPLGKVSTKLEGQRWRIHYNKVDGEFTAGKTRARIQGRDADLAGNFLLENGRGYVPLASLASILPRFLGGPVTMHEDSGRLFVGNIATHFTASLAGNNQSSLVFNFTAPVNPTVATEPGSLRMTFNRDPVIAPASTTLTFGSKTLPSATYSESNGQAVVTVTSTAPVMATFSNGNRTITMVPAAIAAAQNAQQAVPPGQPSAAQQTPAPPTTQAPQIPRRYFAVVDASHGGDDRGESLSATLFEKDVTIALARSLKQELESRGVTTLVLRDSDANLTLDQRAAFANTSHAAIYIALHSASNGHGVRVYTSLLPFGGDDQGPFRSWTTSQHNALPLSQSAASGVAAELQKRQIPVRTLAAPLRPLNNVTSAALAIEIAPQGSDVMQLTAPDYQQLVTGAVATAIAAQRDKLGAVP